MSKYTFKNNIILFRTFTLTFAPPNFEAYNLLLKNYEKNLK
jgi:hypothetical protein